MLMKLRSQIKRTNNQKGFTLVELMVVVVIIGILVAVAIPVYNNVTAKANRSSVEANIRTIESAILQYNAAHDLSKIDSTGIAEIKKDGEYMQKWPTGPDHVTYGVDETSGKATAVGTNDTGTWFTPKTTATSLPISW